MILLFFYVLYFILYFLYFFLLYFLLFHFSTSSCQLSCACVPWVKTSLSFSTTRRRCQLLASLTQQPSCQFSDRAILTITTIKRNNKTKQTTSTFKTKRTTRRRCQPLASLTQQLFCQQHNYLSNNIAAAVIHHANPLFFRHSHSPSNSPSPLYPLTQNPIPSQRPFLA